MRLIATIRRRYLLMATSIWLGDTVNLAARLEELNKERGTRILVAASTRTACGERFAFKNLGFHQCCQP